MKTIKGMNDKVAVLVKDEKSDPIPTFKEVALNIVSLYRPKPNEDVPPAERLKVTKLGLALLTAKDTWEVEDEYFEVLKKVLNGSHGYPEFIMGQWTEKFNKVELEEAEGKKKG